MSQTNGIQRRTLLAAAASGITLPLAHQVAWAQSAYPNKPVKVIVPFAPGGGPDVLMRKSAGKLGEILGQNVVVENIVGAGGILAAQTAARAAPDGYTVILGSSAHVVQKAMQPSVKFDPVKDFVHVMRTTVGPQLVVVAANAPWKTMQELVAALKKEPGKMNYASGGVGSAAHLVGAAVLLATDTQAVHVPYKASVEIIPSVLAGATQVGFPIATTGIGPVQQGSVRALATSGSSRLPQLPQVPTLKEALGKDELALESWGGVWVPAGTPAPVVDVLFKAFTRLFQDPQIRTDHESAGAYVALSASPAEYARFMETETAKFERLVKAIGLNTN